MKITMNENDLFKLQEAMRKWPHEINQAASWVINRVAQEAARDMKIDVPKAFSLLANSISVDKESPQVAWVGPHVRYAWWVIHGRQPGGGIPPVKAIQDWINVKKIRARRGKQEYLANRIAGSIWWKGIPKRDAWYVAQANKIPGRIDFWTLKRMRIVFET